MPYSSAWASRSAASSAWKARTRPASITAWSSCGRLAVKDNPPKVKDRVIVIGGGNVAVDVARTALRLGAKSVEMVCLEQRQEMPALPEEVEATLEEGITIHNGWGPQPHPGQRQLSTGIEFKRCTSVYDENGRFSPVYDENNLTTLEADQIIVAIGQALDKQFIDNTGVATERGML